MTQSINSGLCKLLILLGMLSALVSPAAAVSVTKTARSGNVKAELSYQKTDTEFPQFSQLCLKIVRAGEALVDQPLPESEGTWPLVALETEWARENHQQTFQVRDLEADQEPEVLVDLYTGGVHCCTYSLIYHYDLMTTN